jgi:small-conductance mechanosensitive channel
VFEYLYLTIFGKAFFKWQGRQETKKQILFKKLDILVGEDSLKELQGQIDEITGKIDRGEYSDVELKNVQLKLEDLNDMLAKTHAKLEEHQTMLNNHNYKLELLRRL